MTFYIFLFIVSCILIFWAARILIEALTRIARFLEWKEFVVAFIVIAIAASIPNLFVGITAAVHKVPQLSFGDVVGNNLINLTLAVALATFFAKGLPAGSRIVQSSAIFTMAVAILPLLLILDKVLSRGDGIILISTFVFYILWLFSKKERFSKVYERKEAPIIKQFKIFIKDLGRIILGIFFLIIASEGIVRSASFFVKSLDLSIALVGILIVALGTALPETYFAVVAARKAKNWMILGDLMGAIIVSSTLVLGIVALIYPIEIPDFSPFAIARFFLIIAAVFFLFFVRTGQKITKKEALFLLGLYIAFITIEILIK